MELTGGQALARSLVDEGIETVFGLPGVQLDWLFDALYEQRDALTVYHTRHEQATAYMADGYARSTGKIGACLVVPGPGVLNAGAGLATAYACSSPVLCLAGQIDSRAIDRDLGMLHEVSHQLELLRSLTKWSGRADSLTEIPTLVHEASRQIRSGRPRPAAIELPVDLLQQRGPVQFSGPIAVTPEAGDPALIRAAADLLHHAERPVIYSGGGTLAAGAWDELRALAELLEAPVVMSTDGRGALTDRHHLAHTGLTGQSLCAEADLLLGVGTRLWQPARAWGVPAARTIRIDADPAEIARHGEPAVGIVGDACAALAALRDLLDGRNRPPSRASELAARKSAAEATLARFQPQATFAAAIRAAIPDNAIVVNDLTQVTFFATLGFPVYQPRTFLGPGYQGTLGSAYATALGAQAGNPDRCVVALAGDGGFMYTLPELATARQHDLPVIAIVFNDNAYGNVKRTQQQLFGGRLLGADLVNPDFVALAASFGVRGIRVDDAAGLERVLREAVAAKEPCLIEAAVGEMPNFWPVLLPAGGAYPVML